MGLTEFKLVQFLREKFNLPCLEIDKLKVGI